MHFWKDFLGFIFGTNTKSPAVETYGYFLTRNRADPLWCPSRMSLDTSFARSCAVVRGRQMPHSVDTLFAGSRKSPSLLSESLYIAENSYRESSSLPGSCMVQEIPRLMHGARCIDALMHGASSVLSVLSLSVRRV